MGLCGPWYPRIVFSFYETLLEGLPTNGRSSTCAAGKSTRLELPGSSTRKEDQNNKNNKNKDCHLTPHGLPFFVK